MTHTKEERAKGIAKSLAKIFNNEELLNVSLYELHFLNPPLRSSVANSFALRVHLSIASVHPL